MKSNTSEVHNPIAEYDFRELCIDGNWVHLTNGQDQIDVYISNFFWRQAVFVNGEKVSQTTTLMKHKFKYLDEQYELKFMYQSMKDGECQLFKNDSKIDSNYFCLYDEESKSDFRKLVIHHSVHGLGVGLISAEIITWLVQLI